MEDMKDILRKWRHARAQLEEAYQQKDRERVIKAAKQLSMLAGEILEK